MKYLKNFNTLKEYEGALILDVPNTSYIVENDEVKYLEQPKIPNNYILYTSSDRQVITPYATNVFGASLISNNYDDFGLMGFDGVVTSIGNYAFNGCSSLTSVTIPNSITSIGDYAFYGCSSLTSPVYNAHCFAYMPTSYSGAYTIPEGIEQIPHGAFSGCSSLTSVTIPNSVTSIGNTAFEGCSSITSVVWNAKHCADLPSTLFSNQVTSLVFGDGVEHIPAYLCYGMKKLTAITIPNSVTSIGYYAFQDCSGLISVTIGDGVESIGYYAFGYCTSLTSITIPNSVTSIGSYVFGHEHSLTSVTINSDAIVSKDYSSWSGVVSMFGPNVPEYIIGESVTSIGERAFEGCSDLTSVTIGSGVTSIGEGAFDSCYYLTSITCKSTTPPSLGSGTTLSSVTAIYVPTESVEAYKTTDNWNSYADIIQPIPES